MFQSLRGRLILSHVLPLLVIVPLVGIALIYVLETQVMLNNLSKELMGQAMLIAEMSNREAGVWEDSDQAQAFVTYLNTYVDARVMLLDSRGNLLASNDPNDSGQLGLPVDAAGVGYVLEGTPTVNTIFSHQIHREVVEVLVPVSSTDQHVVGIIRLNHQLASISERFYRLRFLIAGVLVGGLVVGAVIGWVLALNLEKPLRQATLAVSQLASGAPMEPLPEQGPIEIRQLIVSVNTLVDRLHSLEKARRQLLSNLVHELGRPLGALHSAVRALLSGADKEEILRQDLLEGIDGEIKRLSRLVDDLSNLHGQVMGNLELNRSPVDMGEWLNRATSPWREEAKNKGLDWIEEMPGDLPTLNVDVDRLGQALGNLLSNAIKFNPAGGSIGLTAAVVKQEFSLAVRDSGPGISTAEQELVFAPFYKSKAGRRFPQGMGLGLSIARDLVVAHGGRVEISSKPGQGSVFTIVLPLK